MPNISLEDEWLKLHSQFLVNYKYHKLKTTK